MPKEAHGTSHHKMASSPRRCVALYGTRRTSSTLQRDRANRRSVPRGSSSTTMTTRRTVASVREDRSNQEAYTRRLPTLLFANSCRRLALSRFYRWRIERPDGLVGSSDLVSLSLSLSLALSLSLSLSLALSLSHPVYSDAATISKGLARLSIDQYRGFSIFDL